MQRGYKGVSRLGVWLCGAWLLGASASAQAQTATASDTTQGDLVFERAYDAYSKGDFQVAAALFEQAAAYFPHCPTSTALRAKSLEQLGRLGEAYEAYANVNPKPPTAEEAPPCAEARREAQAKMASLGKHVGWLRLEMAPDAAPPTTDNQRRIWLTLPNAPGPAANRQRYVRSLPAPSPSEADGAGALVWERLAVTAGAVVVAVDANGASAQAVTLTPGTTTTVTFPPPGASAGAPVQAAPDASFQTSDADAAAYQKPWIWVGGAGLAAIVLGTVTGIVASNQTDEVKAECDSAARLCTTKGIEARDSANTLGWVSNVSFGVGLAGLVTAGVLYLNGDGDEAQNSQGARVRVLPGVASSAGADGATLSVAW